MGVKGSQTKAAILDVAMSLARVEGLDALSIGRLAKGVGLSKSGLFSHFNSKQALQIEVLERAAEAFVDVVVRPALKHPRGEPRLRVMFERWLKWANAGGKAGGCVFVGAAAEYDDRPGEVKNVLVRTQREWLQTLTRAAAISIEVGHFRKDVDPSQFAFEVYGLMMSYHLYRRLLEDPSAEQRAVRAFEDLLTIARQP